MKRCLIVALLGVLLSDSVQGQTATRTSTPTPTHPPTPILTPIRWAVERGRVWTIVEGSTLSGDTGCAVAMTVGHKTVRVNLQSGTLVAPLVCQVSVHGDTTPILLHTFTGSGVFEFDTNCELVCFQGVTCTGCRWDAWIGGDG